MRRSDSELKPRNGHTLIVGVPCRISCCANQKEASLDDQQDNARAEIAERYQGAVDFRVIASIGKGERLDRPELEQIEKAYSSSEYDVFVYDDLSRLIRGGDAVRLLGIGVDNGTRSICINDGIDTAEERVTRSTAARRSQVSIREPMCRESGPVFPVSMRAAGIVAEALTGVAMATPGT